MSNNSEKNVNSVTLKEWIMLHHSEDELKELFLNMDKALKYIHKHGCYIGYFYPTYINVLYDRSDCIQFQDLVEMPADSASKNQRIKDDIFRSAFIQIGLYTKTLEHLTNPDTLRENFDAFAENIPAEYVPYYRGVVQRGASVYLSEFAAEKANRELAELEKQLEGSGGTAINKPLVKSNVPAIDLENNEINDQIYGNLSGYNKEAAFVNALLIPAIVVSILSIMLALSILIG